MDNIEGIINGIFKNEIQIKRIRKEIQQINSLPNEEFKVSMKQGNSSLQIQVELPEMFQINSGRPIVFLIYLDQRFPFVFPQVYLLSHVTKLTLADGRDYIEDIIHQPWSPSVLLHEIIQSFPKFIDGIRQNQQNREYLLQLGKFHLQQEFDVDLGFEDVEHFQCKEIINGNTYQRTLQLSNSYILVLEISNKVLILVSATPTKDLMNISIMDGKIILVWKTGDENQMTQTLITNNHNQFIDSVKAYKTGSSGKKIQEEDVTLQKFNQMEIEELLQQIENQENQFEDNINKEQLNILMHLYQQAIEYYSAFSDDEYQQYVVRLQKLLGREEIQAILASN